MNTLEVAKSSEYKLEENKVFYNQYEYTDCN